MGFKWTNHRTRNQFYYSVFRDLTYMQIFNWYYNETANSAKRHQHMWLLMLLAIMGFQYTMPMRKINCPWLVTSLCQKTGGKWTHLLMAAAGRHSTREISRWQGNFYGHVYNLPLSWLSTIFLLSNRVSEFYLLFNYQR